MVFKLGIQKHSHVHNIVGFGFFEKAKKEDFRVEEELRSQKVKYEEASDDVLRRMQVLTQPTHS
jgi:hypothetical protein